MGFSMCIFTEIGQVDMARLAERARNYTSPCQPTTGCCAGGPVAWKLMPYPSPPMYALPTSSHATRGGFANHQLWVTPYSEEEFWPAGMHPYARGRNSGLPEWTQQVCFVCLPVLATFLIGILYYLRSPDHASQSDVLVDSLCSVNEELVRHLASFEAAGRHNKLFCSPKSFSMSSI